MLVFVSAVHVRSFVTALASLVDWDKLTLALVIDDLAKVVLEHVLELLRIYVPLEVTVPISRIE